MDKNHKEIFQELISLGIDKIKISQREIAIEKGIGLRAVRDMKKENPATYSLFEDALKFRKIMAQTDVKIVCEFSEDENMYWLYKDNKKIIGFDESWLRNSKLDDRELKNLRREEIGETTIRDKVFEKELIEQYCGGVVAL